MEETKKNLHEEKQQDKQQVQNKEEKKEVETKVSEENKTADKKEAESQKDSKIQDKKVKSTQEDDKKEAKEETIDESTKEESKEDKEAIYIEKLQRLMAEFDNYRKRSEKEKLEIYDRAASNTLVEMLPIVDNFERALKVESSDKAFFDGVNMIYKQLISVLEKMGVKAIEAVGQPFDPNLHNAILHIEDENYGENEVVEELQKGYLFKDKVLRHSMVKVAN